jgi:hypothetical protein
VIELSRMTGQFAAFDIIYKPLPALFLIVLFLITGAAETSERFALA